MKALITTILLLASSAAWSCTPIHGPTTITASGAYCLQANITTSNVGITIAAPAVDLNMNGFIISCQRVALSRGIEINAGMYKTVIRNGRIVGCSWGIRGWYGIGWGFVARDMVIQASGLRGIQVAGDFPRCERCHVYNTGPSRTPGYSRIIGIEMSGNDLVMLDPIVIGTLSPGPINTGDSAAISCTGGNRCLLVRPMITGGNGEGWEFGIWNGSRYATIISPVIEGYAAKHKGDSYNREVVSPTGAYATITDGGEIVASSGGL